MESTRRRDMQLAYNRENHITPATIQKNIDTILSSPYEADYVTVPTVSEEEASYMTGADLRLDGGWTTR